MATLIKIMKIKALKGVGKFGLPHIVMPEGTDPRIIKGAYQAIEEGLCSITLLGKKDEVEAAISAAKLDVESFSIINSESTEKLDKYSDALFEHRKSKFAGLAAAKEQAMMPLNFAALMVRLGDADGTIGGAQYTTAETVRAAFQIIGRADGVGAVSSFFLMGLNKKMHGRDDTIIFADCALIVNPTSEQLGEIAIASAQSFEAIIGGTPKVAMLSFSTKGSAKHPDVRKIQLAMDMIAKNAPDLAVDGEMQFDAAFVEAVGKQKAPDSKIAGQANIFIFPNLDAGNIGYKIAQRIGGASATGPILQGLAKPANDLSRGCDSEDVYNMILTTVNQVFASKN